MLWIIQWMRVQIIWIIFLWCVRIFRDGCYEFALVCFHTRSLVEVLVVLLLLLSLSWRWTWGRLERSSGFLSARTTNLRFTYSYLTACPPARPLARPLQATGFCWIIISAVHPLLSVKFILSSDFWCAVMRTDGVSGHNVRRLEVRFTSVV